VGARQNPEHPEAPVCPDIYAHGRLIGQVLSNRYREDLAKAGLGSGCHGFELALSEGLGFAADAVEVRRTLDGAAVPGRGRHSDARALPPVRLERSCS
jgi:hypothetical protein